MCATPRGARRCWWHALILDTFDGAREAWDRLNGENHQLEPEEFLALHPMPTLSSIMHDLAS